MKEKFKQEQNAGIFYIIKKFFSKIFERNKKKALPKANNIINTNSNDIKNERIKDKEKRKTEIQIMQEEFNRNQEKETLLKQIENNPRLLNNWPIEKLERLEKLYDEKVVQLDNEIARLRMG